MSAKLHPDKGTLAENIAKKYFPCTCGEIYLSRKLTAPDCPYHAFDWEEAFKEYAASSPKITGEEVHPQEPNFQNRINDWMQECFGEVISKDKIERNHRFLEEALELVQSLGCTQSESHQLVDYVFSCPTGEAAQEVGGVMVTLAALCLANDLDMEDAGEMEYKRISVPEIISKIRNKQASKPKHSPLPALPANHDKEVASKTQ